MKFIRLCLIVIVAVVAAAAAWRAKLTLPMQLRR